MNDHRQYAVLTGDIVKSTILSPNELDIVRRNVLDAAIEVKNWQRGLLKGKAEFFRGDSWQLLLMNPEMALRVSVFVRASLLAKGMADSRISIGLGTIEKISPHRISLSTGEAFVASGHGLDQMANYTRLTIEVPKSMGAVSDWLPVVGNLCDSLISQWTERQAETVCMAVRPHEPTQEEIAEALDPPVSRQNVTKALDSAHWVSIRSAIRQFEATNWASISRKKGNFG